MLCNDEVVNTMHNWTTIGITRIGDLLQRCNACGVERVIRWWDAYKKA